MAAIRKRGGKWEARVRSIGVSETGKESLCWSFDEYNLAKRWAADIKRMAGDGNLDVVSGHDSNADRRTFIVKL